MSRKPVQPGARRSALALWSGILAGTAWCVAAAMAYAAAIPPPAAMAGRWSGETYSFAPERKPLTLDIVKCGESWCGVEVTKDGVCGGTALRLGEATERSNSWEFTGRLELDGGKESYAVMAFFVPAEEDSPAHWAFAGNTGPELMLYQRSFPFNANLQRTADAVCTAELKTS